MKQEILISLISALIAGSALIFSIFVYWRSRPSIEHKKAQYSQMNILSSETLIFWEQLQVLVAANIKNTEVDPYIYISLTENAKRLEISINKAIGLGLWNEFVPENRSHSMTLHVALVQSLADCSINRERNLDDWLKEHLIMGVIRLIEICGNYKGVSPELRELLNNEVKNELRDQCWIYLEKTA